MNPPAPIVRVLVWGALVGSAGCSGKTAPAAPSPAPVALPPVAPGALRPVAAFAAISDPTARSQALFAEAAKVILHPRCVNCHPADGFPRQGDDGRRHDPPVERGDADHGLPALECGACHQDRNVELARIPGAPGWHLAPLEMAWMGKSAAQICGQIKDPARNGGRTLAQLQTHMAHDPLVAWGWAPGDGRVPAPGSQAELGALVAAWIDSGAACPPETTPEAP